MGQLFSCARGRQDEAALKNRPRRLSADPPSYHDVVPEPRKSIRVPYTVDEKLPRGQLSDDLMPLIAIDEKEPTVFEYSASSASSSIISIPSTRITSLASEYTGRRIGRDSTGSSYAGSTVLPSYHSRRTPSPAPTLGLSGEPEHPVMENDWLGALQQRANEAGTSS